jgi:glycosyltransferase involved in cell wall biosynthesis
VPSPRRRVLFIASAYPRYEGDVITPWLGATIAQLRDAQVDVEVLAPAYHGLTDQTIDGVRVHRFRYAPAKWEMLSHDHPIPWQLNERPIRTALVPGYVTASAIAATRLTAGRRFDVVHAFWPLPHAIPGMVARCLTRTPLVSTFFGAELHWLARKHAWARVAVRAIVHESEVVTAISEHTASELKSVAPDARPVVIPFGAAITPPTSHAATRTPFAEQPAEFLFVGRLVARKGVDVLLQALARMDERAARLTIVGDGAERGRLEALATSLSLAGRARFAGYVPQDALEQQLRACDAFVLPAITDEVAGTEGLGVALIEALSYERPVIASRAGGIPDVVRHEHTGLLVAPGDVDALAAAMRRFIDEPTFARTLGAQGRADVEDRFSWSRIVDALQSVYEDAISRRAR